MSLASASICTASSRVGAMISALRQAAAAACWRWKMVIRKAAVLPVPVCDCTATSLPVRESARVFSWTGVSVGEAHVADPAQQLGIELQFFKSHCVKILFSLV